MTYLLRLVLPDRPGSLGVVASALGRVGADIVSLDVVEHGPDGAVDDLLVDLPPGGLADSLLSAAQSVPGVTVESVRPYSHGHDIHRDLELVDQLAAHPDRALEVLADRSTGVFRAGWGLVLAKTEGGARVVHGSPGAPESLDFPVPWLPLPHARRLDAEEAWVPERWGLLATEMAAAPVGDPTRAVLVGRPGGPRFRASEVVRLAHLAGIAATVAATAGSTVAHA